MSASFDSLFEFLFKYRPVVFEKGHLAFAARWPVYLAILAGLAIAVPALVTYARVRPKSGPRDRVVLGVMRTLLLATLLFCLFRPMLLLSAAVTQRNFIGILLDDSRSMQIADGPGGAARSEFVSHSFGTRDSALLKALSEKFLVRFFRFSGTAERMTDVSELRYAGTKTHLGPALELARQELASVPLSGLVLVTDGADNSNAALASSLVSLKARAVPIFTVGVGRETFTKDIEISRVETPRAVLKGSALAVDVQVVQRGYRGAKVQLVVEDSGRIVSTEDVTLPADGDAARVRVRIPTEATGPRLFKFRIAPQPGEMVAQNNEREAVVTVTDRKEKILYVEGEPRFEMKFLRRAVAEDENIQLVTLQRTADNKFLRLGVDDSTELSSGFPKTREELFAYRGIVLGSVEASFFTHDQLRMLADFVGERGGGLMMLGGRHAFAEGGYVGTPLADVLPVMLEGGTGDPVQPRFLELKARLTPAGLTSPATQIAATEAASALRWKTMPGVSTVNPIRRVKPGATTLLTGTGAGLAEGQIVLAYQRFGRGKAIALPIQDSWMWQMDAAVTVEDMTHEQFWRQMLRWLIKDVPGPVSIAAAAERVAANEPMTLRAEVSDKAFARVNNATVIARVSGPTGSVDVPLQWTVDTDGEYRGTFTPKQAGTYRVEVEARRNGETLGSEPTFVRAGDLRDEFFDAGMRASLLKRLAEETGGRFYTPETVASLPKDIVFTEGGTTELEQMDLWDMPVIFLVLIGLVGTEWGYRKLRGLA